VSLAPFWLLLVALPPFYDDQTIHKFKLNSHKPSAEMTTSAKLILPYLFLLLLLAPSTARMLTVLQVVTVSRYGTERTTTEE
jgi:hypothetical protein